MRTRYVYDFPRPSVTATIFLFERSTWNSNVARIILGRRGRKDGAYSGFLCVPGGFLDAKVDIDDVVEVSHDALAYLEEPDAELTASLEKPGETIEETAIREVFEETGLVITKDQLELAYVHSNPNTDPRAHVVNVCYFVVLDHRVTETAVAGDDLEELLIEDVHKVHEHTLAFNHNELFEKVLEVAEQKYPDSEDE